MAASVAKGCTILENCAREPEVVDLANFLNAMGARIRGAGSSVIEVEGVRELKGCEYRVMPDRIEAGTYLVAGAITAGELRLLDCPVDDLDALITKLREMNVSVEAQTDGSVLVRRNGPLLGVDVTTQPHPGFPTDMQALSWPSCSWPRDRAPSSRRSSKTLHSRFRTGPAWARASRSRTDTAMVPRRGQVWWSRR
jgi:UDP-N-acetylglucosamine 1-carboxyvinyltransferase